MFSLQRQVYLDNNATTPVSRAVQKKMAQVLCKHYGNPSSPYSKGRSAARVLEQSRESIAQAIGARAEEIIFTSSATEANNFILKSLAQNSRSKGKTKIIASPIEHPSIKETLAYLSSSGFTIDYISVDKNGVISLEQLEEMIDENTFLVCCMLANNEIGTIQNMRGISEITKKKGVRLLSDCVQGLGKVAIDVNQLGIDFATFSAHKIHGPKGIGAAYIKSDITLSPFIHGGHQESGIRAGTESLHNIAGFAEACKAIPYLLKQQQKIQANKTRFTEKLRQLKPDIEINSPEDSSLANTTSIRFPGFNNAMLMAALDHYGISVSAGSACSTAGTEPSHVLTAIGLSDAAADETLRFSLAETTKPKELDYTLKILDSIFSGKVPEVQALKASTIDQSFISNPDNFLLDIRFWHERKMLKGLPNSSEASFIFFKRYIDQVPKNKHVVVVCMGGVDATAVAFQLKKRGYHDVSFIIGGVVAWRLTQSALYKTQGGTNIVQLQPNLPH